MRKLKIIVLGFIAGFSCFYFLYQFMPINLFKIEADSMYPTLEDGQYVFVLRHQLPELGQIVVFSHEEYNYPLIKRVVGIPGDVVVGDGVSLFVNDENIGIDCEKEFELVVAPDSFYVVGDNTANSIDSRHWNNPFVGYSNVLGVVTE